MTETTDAETSDERIERLTEIFEDITDGSCVTVEEQHESPHSFSSDNSDDESDRPLTDVLNDGLEDAVAGADAGQVTVGNEGV